VFAVLFSVLSICAFKRGTARRVTGVHWYMPRRRQLVDWLFAAMLLAGAMFEAMPVLADGQRTYLDLSHDTMRQQLAANDLQAAARTLSWIRRVDSEDEVAAVLSAELQLRRGNVALAAMSLIDIISGEDTGQAAVLEAQRVLTDLGDGDYLAGVIVTDAMLEDAARRDDKPLQALLPAEEGAFAYAVAMAPQPDADQLQRLLAFAPTTPAIEMAKAAGRALPVPLPGAPAPGVTVETAVLQTPVPATPDGKPPALIDLVFENPADLELNFALFQEQMATNDLDGASATLERVLLIDPRSKLAKVLLADVKLRKGDLIQARSILRTLLAEENTPPDMAARAEAIAVEVESRLDPLSTQTRLALEWGNTQNAFGRADADEILFLNLPITNNTPDKSDTYVSYEVGFDAVRELDRQTPTLLEAGIAVTGRDTAHRDLSDVRSMSARLSVTQRAALTLSAGGFASLTRVNHKSFNQNAGVYAALVTPFADNWEASQSLSFSRSTYAAYPGIANNTGRSERTAVAKFGLSRQFSKALVNLAVSAGKSKARNRINDLKFTKTELTMAGMIGDFSVTGTLSRQWTTNDVADVFVSPLRPKRRQDNRMVKLRYPRGSSVGNFYFIPYLRMSSSSTKSNIPNSRREGSEAAIGLETVF
jgi:thioredoxin-like negative regulator of GroEL